MRFQYSGINVHDPAGNERFWRWLAGGYFAAISLGHLEFSQWLVRKREGPLGPYSYQEFMPYLMFVSVIILAVWVGIALRRTQRPWRLALLWSLWGTSVALVERYLTYSVNEFAHYPQYALLAWLLAKAFDPDRSKQVAGRILFWTTLLGIVDETQQYLWLAPSYSNYLDFNDFLVNLLAAVAGILLYYGIDASNTGQRAVGQARVEWASAMLLAVAVAIALASGRLVPTTDRILPPGGIVRGDDGAVRIFLERSPSAYSSWGEGPYRGRYWVLGPLEGTLLLLTAGGLFISLLPQYGRSGRHSGMDCRNPEHRDVQNQTD